MFENKKESLITRKAFAWRLIKSFLVGFIIVFFSILFGTIGYHHFCQLSWIDSFHMANLILTGMGPTAEMKTDAAKLFSSFYALYSGVAFLTMIATLLAPVLHRILHVLHMEDE